jgi:hypothetical protein
MKARLALYSLAIFLASAPAAAQEVRAYDCTANGSNEVTRHMFGPGEYHEYQNGSWTSNWCADTGTKCTMEGSKFSANGDMWEFTYDYGSARFTYSDFGGSDDAGVCRPE